MDLQLEGKVALVTGSSRGLGLAASAALLGEGAKVIGAARSEGGLGGLLQEHPGQIAHAAYDARDPGAAGALVERTLETFGRIDILVNNAAIAPAGRFLETDPELWHDVLQVNVLAPVTLTQAVGAHLLEQHSGKVINISSLTGLRGKAWLSAYSASKGALVRLTEAVAAEWAPDVQVNSIAPGAFRTDAQRQVVESEELRTRRLAKVPAARFGEANEIGPLLCYLASPASDFVTGATFTIDGGELAKL
jgi:NAD(P)-dependent dehydrogenase (short-subunit alcohol dehydrogenase family)